MKLPEGHRYHEIRNEDGFVTNADYTDQRSTLLRQMRGLRNNTPGLIMERDFGTRLMSKVMPVEDPRTITHIDDNGSGLIRVTVPGHGYATSDQVYIFGVTGTVEANGVWSDITKIDDDNFDLDGSTFTNAWTNGGIVGKVPIGNGVDGKGIYAGTILNDPTTKTSHAIVVGIDSNDKSRVFIDNSSDASGAWEEIGRTISCKVNDASIGASDYVLEIDTVTERGVPITLRTNEVVGYIAVNSTRSTGESAQKPTVVTSATPIVVTIEGHGYENGDILYGYGFEGLYMANGYWKVANKSADTFELSGSVGAGQPAWTSGTGYFKKVSSVVLITVSDGISLTSNAVLGSNGQNWQDDDDITLYRTTAGYYGITEALGTTPHFRFNEIDDQRKVNVYHGPDRQNLVIPFSVQRQDARDRFYSDTPYPSGTKQLTLTAGLYAERATGNSGNHITQLGTITARIGDGSDVGNYFAAGIYEKDVADPWAVMTGYFGGNSVMSEKYSHYFTIDYGYQESDPVLIFHVGRSPTYGAKALSSGKLYVNPAKMPKGAIGIREYIARVADAAPDVMVFKYSGAIYWSERPEIPALPTERYIWVPVATDEGGMVFYAQEFAVLTGTLEISDSLGHAPRIEDRADLKPKFAVRAARSQGGIIVVNEDDRTLRVSGYSEDTHMDDIFPDVIQDVNSAKQKIFLGSRGELLGLAFAGVTNQLTGLATGVLFAFKSTEVEFYDFKDNSQGVVGADFLGVDSLCPTPYGIVFGGNSGIWLIPNGSIRPQEMPLNFQWRNLYDGTLKTDDGTTSRVSDAARQALKIGYNPYFNEIWCRLEVIKADNSGTEIVSIRYSLTNKRWIGERKLGTPQSGEINFFSQHSTGVMVLGCPHGLLLYPNLVGYQFSDNVDPDATEVGELLEVSMRFSVGELHTKTQSFSLFNMKIKHLCTVVGNRMATLKVFTNNFATPLYTRKIPLAELEPNVLLDGSIGRLNNVQFEFSFPTNLTELADIQEYEMNTMAIGFVPAEAKGGF